MPISERAKQFSPFSPLSGLEAALTEKEKSAVPERTLSDDAIAQISETLAKLNPGDLVTVFFYDKHELIYTQITDRVRGIDIFSETLTVGDAKIQFAELYEVLTHDTDSNNN